MRRPVWLLALAWLVASGCSDQPAGPGSPFNVWAAAPSSYGPPPTRIGLAVTTDPVYHLMIAFAGDSGTWIYSLQHESGWSRLSVTGSPPPAPYTTYTAVFDPAESRLLVFGAPDSTGGLWELSSAGVWTQLQSGQGPSGEYPKHAFYDAARSRVVLLSEGEMTVWTISLPELSWTRLDDPGDAHPKRRAVAAGFDSVRNRILIYGGTGIIGSWFGQTGEVWSFDLATAYWSRLDATPVQAQWGCAGVVDPVNDQLIVFSGYFTNSSIEIYNADLWTLSLDSAVWTKQPETAPWPRDRRDAVIVLDGRKCFVAGGHWAGFYRDTWKLDLDTMAWTQLEPKVSPQGDSYSVPSGGMLEVPAPGLLANDRFLAGITATGLDPVAPPAHGSLELRTDGSFRYRPDQGFQGSDAFDYAVRIGQYQSDPTHVSIGVSGGSSN